MRAVLRDAVCVGEIERPVWKWQVLAVKAFRQFGVTTYAEPEQAPPPGDLGRFFRFVPGVDAGDFNMYFRTDAETPETVPWKGLEATTR